MIKLSMGNTVGSFGSLYLGVNNKAVRNLRNSLTLSDKQKSLIYGTMLGDGCITGNQNGKQKNYRLKIGHSVKQKDLVFWKYEILKNFVLSPPSYRLENNSWGFRTISHPEITQIKNIFYRDKKKILPQNIENILKDKLALAVWYMDDGCRWISNGIERGLILNTQNFNPDEIQKLVELFIELYEIEPKVHKDHNRYRLHIRVKDQYEFSDLFKEHIVDTLKYKLPKYP